MYTPWQAEKAKAKASWKADVAEAKAWWWCEKHWWCHNSKEHHHGYHYGHHYGPPPSDCPIKSAGTKIFSKKKKFEALLSASIVDPYDNVGYTMGDNADFPNFDSFTDAGMTAVIGETQYTSTGFVNNNLITNQASGDPIYCAGCNGSYRLTFTSTSIGTPEGVFAAGVVVAAEAEGVFGTIAFVTYGDGSTDEFPVPDQSDGEDPFWGIIDCRRIASIHMGLAGGAPNIDNDVQRMAQSTLIIGV
ncbi:unnamed protein product [Symbiodinium pilosum]|uniref:Uncharacterized protein n=1 Tax=Symbiodinium pilosum TaxID=2952 RepID=A0A812R0E9_SYMPI|nr:unnamed protein product [Symbiodinium pilosum]